MVKKDIYQEITNRIILDFKKGTPVWEKPWKKGVVGVPINTFSKTFYSGINTLTLWMKQAEEGFETSQWLSFLQAKNLGGSIKKGETAAQIMSYKKLEVTDEKTEEIKTIHIHKKHFVFNISQTKGLDHLINRSSSEDEPVFQDEKKAEELIKASKAQINFAPIDRACYFPGKDKILMPKREQFKTKEGFYSTLFHELSHWTGHKSRLNRKKGNKKGSKAYAFEELIAEISASFICCHLGFKYSTQHSTYIKHYLEVLKKDKQAIFKAASKAQKATEFILNFNNKENS